MSKERKTNTGRSVCPTSYDLSVWSIILAIAAAGLLLDGWGRYPGNGVHAFHTFSTRSRGWSRTAQHRSSSDTVAMAAGTKRIPLDTSDDNNYEDDDDEGPVEPGKMRVSEIKAELDLREVSYADCFDKDSLAERLATARASGQADPTILNQFNKQNLEQQFSSSSSSGSSTSKINLSDQEIEAAAANDGTLPGGLTPEMFKKLTGNPDIMMLLQSTKMQEAMKLMMTGGQSELEQKLKEDPELQTTVQRLDEIMKSFR